MFWDSAAKTALGIKAMGVDNVGVLLDFGHALFGGESPAAAAQLLIDHDLLWAMDVNDNLRGWDDDMVVGTVHPVELFEFFYTLKSNGWEGVWQLDQFPFREDTVEAARLSIRFLQGASTARWTSSTSRRCARRSRARTRSAPSARPGCPLRMHGGGVVTNEEDEDLVPNVDPAAVPGGDAHGARTGPGGSDRGSRPSRIWPRRRAWSDAATSRWSMRRASGHIGGEFSVIDILVTLYLHAMNISPDQLGDPERDRFILSKGHAAAALYTTLAMAGFLPPSELATFMQPKSQLNGHPARTKIAAVEASTGPLGHGLPIAVGTAFAGKLDGSPRRTFVVVGDGELQEGSNWEALMTAGNHRLEHLCVVVDRNRLQQGARVADTNDLEPLADKLAAFGLRRRRGRRPRPRRTPRRVRRPSRPPRASRPP